MVIGYDESKLNMLIYSLQKLTCCIQTHTFSFCIA